MNVVELSDKTKQVDAILYNLMGEYLEDGMDAEAKSQFERWWDLLVRTRRSLRWDLKCIDVFNSTPLKTKKKIYEEG